MDKKDLLNLKKRYLIWLYKNTKDSLDKIERKFTQLAIDKIILKELEKHKKLGKFILEFKDYMQNKEKEGLNLKYIGKQLKPDYTFSLLKLKAIEQAIIKTLGRNALKEIKSLYEKEMTERILKSTETR